MLMGDQLKTIDLGLNRQFTWNFIIADVKVPIIGSDFLAHFDLLIDLIEIFPQQRHVYYLIWRFGIQWFNGEPFGLF